MSGIATAVVGAAVIGSVASSKATDKAVKATGKAADTASEETRRAADEARADINRLFPQAQQTAQQGFQGALDVFGQSLPAQTSAFQQGNVGAQQAILQGLPQIQNALLGGKVDFSQLQPFQMEQPDLSFFNQTLPQIQQQQTQQQQGLTNQDMGFGGFLPPNDLFIGPLQNHSGILNQRVNQDGAGFNQNNLLGGRNFNLSNRMK